MRRSNFRITDSKGFSITFDNGWTISVQFGRGNYSDNYFGRQQVGESFPLMNARLGNQGSRNAECAVIDPAGDMVQLPSFMFDEGGYQDMVSNRSTPKQVLQLMNWVAEQPAKA